MNKSETFCRNSKDSTTRAVTKESEDSHSAAGKKTNSSHRVRHDGGLRTAGLFKRSKPNVPLVTIVTVVLDGKLHLEQTIQSVLGQTYENVEYIVIDGGSTDGTLDIIQKHEHAIDYWVSESDKGLFDAMNKGIALATGEWINFMNAGDSLFRETTLQELMSTDSQDAELIYGDHVIRYDFGFSRIVNADSLSNLWKGMVFSHQSLLARRRLLEQNKFPVNRLGSDYGFVLGSLERGKKFYYTNIIVSTIVPGGVSDTLRIRSIWSAWGISKTYCQGIKVHLHYIHLLLWQYVVSMIRRCWPREKLIKWRYGNYELKHYSTRIALISTASKGGLSSMCRYEHLLEKALAGAGWQVEVHHLSLEQKTIQRFSGFFRTLMHHATVWIRAKRLASRLAADIVHIIDGSHGYLVPIFKTFTVVVSVHDVIPVLTQTGKIPGRKPSVCARWIVSSSLAGLKKAERLLAVSSNTAKDLKEVLGDSSDSICVLSNPITYLRRKKCMPSDEHMQFPYVLHVGHNGDYKNRAGVLEVFFRIRQGQKTGVHLIMAGPTPSQNLHDKVKRNNMEDFVTWVVGPTDEHLGMLYAKADLLLFPSYYEGFGWPPLEAMEAGVPVVCSNAASLPEIVGNAALMASPDDYDQLALLCERVLTEDDLRKDLVRKGYENLKRYSFDKYSENLQGVYGSLVSSESCSRRSPEMVPKIVST